MRAVASSTGSTWGAGPRMTIARLGVERRQRVPRGGDGIPIARRGEAAVVDGSLDDDEVGIERRIERGDALAV